MLKLKYMRITLPPTHLNLQSAYSLPRFNHIMGFHVLKALVKILPYINRISSGFWTYASECSLGICLHDGLEGVSPRKNSILSSPCLASKIPAILTLREIRTRKRETRRDERRFQIRLEISCTGVFAQKQHNFVRRRPREDQPMNGDEQEVISLSCRFVLVGRCRVHMKRTTWLPGNCRNSVMKLNTGDTFLWALINMRRAPNIRLSTGLRDSMKWYQSGWTVIREC